MPFPQALKSTKSSLVHSEILEHLKQVKVNLPLLHVMKNISKFAKVIKDLCNIKRKHNVRKNDFLAEQDSVVTYRKNPPKYKDLAVLQ